MRWCFHRRRVLLVPACEEVDGIASIEQVVDAEGIAADVRVAISRRLIVEGFDAHALAYRQSDLRRLDRPLPAGRALDPGAGVLPWWRGDRATGGVPR